MDILSYLLGTQNGGGGGGGFDPTEYFGIVTASGSSSSCGTWKSIVKKLVNVDYASSLKNIGGVFSGFDGTEIEFAPTINTSGITNMSSAFNNCAHLTTVDVSKFNTSNVTDMSYMFYYCRDLASLDLSSFNTGNVTTMESFFQWCTLLTDVNLSSFDTKKVDNMNYMFSRCSELTTLDLSNFETPALTKTMLMFENCTKLAHIDMRKFDLSNVSSYGNMFGGNKNSGVPDNCEIIVADDTQKTWITSKFTRLTNVKTVAEL